MKNNDGNNWYFIEEVEEDEEEPFLDELFKEDSNFNSAKKDDMLKTFRVQKTKEDYLKELREIAKEKNIEILSKDYIDALTPLPLRCKVCSYNWSVKPKRMKDTSDPWGGCPVCRELSRKKKAYEKYKRIAESRNIEIISSLSDYINAKTPINLRCKICQYDWSIRPENLKGSPKKPWGGCPSCRERKKWLIRFPLEEREDYFERCIREAEKRNIEILSEKYKTSHTRLIYRCKICQYKWKAEPIYSALADNWEGCPKCKEKKVLSNNIKFFREVALKNNCIIVSDFVDWDTEIKFKCNKCSYNWSISANSIKYYPEREGLFCPNCRENFHKYQMFIKCKKIGERKYALLLSNKHDYKNNTTDLLWQCKICKQYFHKTLNSINKVIGLACPDCNGKINDYIREGFCKKMLETILNVKFIRHKKISWLIGINGYPLHLDGYNKSLNLAYEHNGIQHYEYNQYFHSSPDDLETVKANDKIKMQKCDLHNVKLIIIPYWIELSEIENYLKNQLDELRIHYNKQFINWKKILKQVRLDAFKSSYKIRDILSFF